MAGFSDEAKKAISVLKKYVPDAEKVVQTVILGAAGAAGHDAYGAVKQGLSKQGIPFKEHSETDSSPEGHQRIH